MRLSHKILKDLCRFIQYFCSNGALFKFGTPYSNIQPLNFTRKYGLSVKRKWNVINSSRYPQARIFTAIFINILWVNVLRLKPRKISIDNFEKMTTIILWLKRILWAKCILLHSRSTHVTDHYRSKSFPVFNYHCEQRDWSCLLKTAHSIFHIIIIFCLWRHLLIRVLYELFHSLMWHLWKKFPLMSR